MDNPDGPMDPAVEKVMKRIDQFCRRMNPIVSDRELCEAKDIEEIVQEGGFNIQIVSCGLKDKKAVRIRATAIEGKDELAINYVIMWDRNKEAPYLAHGPLYVLNGSKRELPAEFEDRAKALDKSIKKYLEKP